MLQIILDLRGQVMLRHLAAAAQLYFVFIKMCQYLLNIHVYLNIAKAT